jgi:sugar/nucleoside kinase (ribokinase family)
LTAVLKGYPPEHCVRLAAAAGASCVTAYDALSGLLPFEELEKKIDQGWEKAKPV